MAYYAPGTIIPSKLHIFLAKSENCGHLPFLDLPGEIRNKIYDLVFQECLVQIGLGNPPPSADKPIKQPLAKSQKQFRNHHVENHDETFKSAGRKVPEKQPSGKAAQNLSTLESKQQQKQKQAVSSQDQKCAAPQKSSKSRNRGPRLGWKGPPRMYSTLIKPEASSWSKKNHLALNLLFSSRQIYNEALCIMYAKTTFQFPHGEAINRFLAVTPPRALQAIQGLHISHETSEEPVLTAHRKWKLLDDEGWFLTCENIRAKMTDLKRLRLHLVLKDWPIQLRPDEDWAKAIMCLRGKGLDRVDATLVHEALSAERLHEAAKQLEIAMMGKEAWIAKKKQDRKILEAKNQKSKESKMAKVLVIKMSDIPRTPKAQKA